jgi:hypothetical protein
MNAALGKPAPCAEDLAFSCDSPNAVLPSALELATGSDQGSGPGVEPKPTHVQAASGSAREDDKRRKAEEEHARKERVRAKNRR